MSRRGLLQIKNRGYSLCNIKVPGIARIDTHFSSKKSQTQLHRFPRGAQNFTSFQYICKLFSGLRIFATQHHLINNSKGNVLSPISKLFFPLLYSFIKTYQVEERSTSKKGRPSFQNSSCLYRTSLFFQNMAAAESKLHCGSVWWAGSRWRGLRGQ